MLRQYEKMDVLHLRSCRSVNINALDGLIRKEDKIRRENHEGGWGGRRSPLIVAHHTRARARFHREPSGLKDRRAGWHDDLPRMIERKLRPRRLVCLELLERPGGCQ